MRVLEPKKRRWMRAAASVGHDLTEFVEEATDRLVEQVEKDGKLVVRRERKS
jgi:hypothetical protein